MSAKGLTMTVVAVAVAAGTYFGLETAFPLKKAAKDSAESNGNAVDEVFKGTLDSSQLAPAEPAREVAADTLSASEPAPEDLGSSESVDVAGTAEMPAEAPVEPAPEPTAAPTPEPTPEPVAAPVEESAAPAATAAPRKPAAKPAPKKPQKLTQWWGPESETQLSLVYAGSAAYTRAVVLMLNGAFDDTTSAEANLRVTDAAGKAVAGKWQIGANNKRMLLFPVDKAGIYTVSVKADLTDRTGRKLGKAQKGPVRVQ